MRRDRRAGAVAAVGFPGGEAEGAGPSGRDRWRGTFAARPVA
ncbi:hypothetical protein SLNWT_0731 [Streptomyces albus]|uniref:Uncharacterized protein n=1 Tax=Streptomyces albus (strain ATCC 21838 / DSM 41398 / FERM P-419 / JCM 4703 / NBRC 107858) TaxID=1081613 RepID=A0A0B5ESK1_STRA4|nr:hypothetical protein SLNWT_0731 [Streptomyces albus]